MTEAATGPAREPPVPPVVCWPPSRTTARAMVGLDRSVPAKPMNQDVGPPSSEPVSEVPVLPATCTPATCAEVAVPEETTCCIMVDRLAAVASSMGSRSTEGVVEEMVLRSASMVEATR